MNEGSDDDSDEDDNSIVNRPRSSKRKSDAAESVDSPPTKKSPNKHVRTKDKRRKLRDYQRDIADYYASGTYHGMHASGVAYNMASQLGRSVNDFLWYAIIGLTFQFINQQVTLVRYIELVTEYREEVARLAMREGRESENIRSVFSTNDDGAKRRPAATEGEDPESEIDEEDLFGENPRKKPTKVSGSKRNQTGVAADDSSVQYHEEFRLMLLTHWSLFESMFHSEYVATKLGIWKEKGRQRLTNLLVKMGFPQKESKQWYKEMNVSYKKIIRPKLLELAPRYNMPDLLFPSFKKNFGHRSCMSSSDVVYSLTALLDGGVTWIQKHGMGSYESIIGVTTAHGASSRRSMQQSHGSILSFSGGGFVDEDDPSGADSGQVGVGVGTKTSAGNVVMHIWDEIRDYRLQQQGDSLPVGQDEGKKGNEAASETNPAETNAQPDWMRNFYSALDALDNINLLQHGVLLAIHFQRLLVRTGTMLLDKKGVQTLKKFHMVPLKQLASDVMLGEGESVMIGRSIPVLHRLTGFLMDAFAVKREFRFKNNRELC